MINNRTEKYLEMLNLIDKGFDLMDEYNSLTHRYGNVMLYQSEAKLIQYIGNHEKATITEIANETGKTTSAYSQLIRKLKSKGFVKQVRNDQNAREYNLFLTEDGKRIFEAHDQFEKFCYKRALDKLDEFSVAEMDTFCRILARLNEAFAMDLEDAYKIEE